MTEKDDAPSKESFLVPKLPVKKPISNIKSALKKISSLLVPTDDYVLPSWAEIPRECDHVIEVMNNGVVAGRYKLKDIAKRGYLTVGRMDTCDIQAAIPTASRIHCYLQYGDGFHGRGWYVFDKSSTQGTFVNKQEVPKSVYYKAKSGSIIQITKANFHLYLEGTDEPITSNDEEVRGNSPGPTFIDELKAKTERSFERDPISVLSKFCEREGLEFKFSKLASEDKDNSTYAFDLPDDVSGGRGASFTGFGSDAQAAQRSCALQVCRHLNEFNLLDSNIQRNARTSLADNEFFEEDEDTFFDRTGQIEEQRKKRIERHKANIGVKEKALTYPELLLKIEQLEQNQQAITDQLTRMLKPQEGAKVSFEEIDVSGLNASLSVRLEISKLKRKYEQLTNELNLLNKAAVMIKPTELKLAVENKKSREPKEALDQMPTTSARIQKEQSPTSQASTSDEEVVKGPAMPPAKKEDAEPKRFGLITRKDLQANKNATLNKRKMAEEEYFEEEEKNEKRNKTDEFEDPNEVVDFVAPAGQTGDGRTKLNDKFGGRY